MTIKTGEEESKLHVGARSRDLSMVQDALTEGCDPNEAGSHGWTSLHEAVSSGSSSITLALLRRGGNVDLPDHLNRNTPLHVAASKGHLKIVQILLDSGAKITTRNIDGKTAEDLATTACKELLQRKLIELLMRGGMSTAKSYQDSSLQKLYPKRSFSPKRQQEHHGSVENMTSMTDCNKNIQPGPGEIKLLFEHQRRHTCLKINILELKDLKLPTVHNYTHIYVKCYLIPDKNKETKRKTSSLRIEAPSEDGYTSRGSSASSQSSTTSQSSTDSADSQISGKFKSVLKKRPHLHSRKNKDEVKCMLQAEEGDMVGRITVPFNEVLSYDGLVLRKFNNMMSECKVHLSICGRNRWTSKGIPIADVIIPVAVGLKKIAMAQTFYLNYKIGVPVSTVHERKQAQMSQSWELKEGGQYTGRSLAWNSDLASEPTEAQTIFKAPGAPEFSSTKKYRKHQSRTSRFLKGEMKLFKGKPNERYKKNTESTSEYSDNSMVDNPGDSSLGEKPSGDEVEYIGRADLSDSPNKSVSSKTVMDRQISEHWDVNKSNDNIFEITKELEVSSAPRPSLKYSRAFGKQSVSKTARNSWFGEEDVALEDVED